MASSSKGFSQTDGAGEYLMKRTFLQKGRTRIDLGENKEQRKALIETEQELTRKGKFKLVFPSPLYTSNYKTFFEESRPLNDYVDSKLFAKGQSLSRIKMMPRRKEETASSLRIKYLPGGKKQTPHQPDK